MQEKPRKSYTTDEEEDAGSSDYSDDLETPTSKGDTWTKSPRKEKTSTTDKSALSSRSPSAASSSPPSVSSRSVSVADRGDKARGKAIQRMINIHSQVGPPIRKEKKKLPQIETRETQYSPVVRVQYCSVHCCAIFFFAG